MNHTSPTLNFWQYNSAIIPYTVGSSETVYQPKYGFSEDGSVFYGSRTFSSGFSGYRWRAFYLQSYDINL